MTKAHTLRLIEKFGFWLAALMPICFILSRGIAVMNMNICCALFIIHLLITKNFKIFKQKWLIAVLIFWMYLMIRSAIQEGAWKISPLSTTSYYARGFLYALFFQNVVACVNKSVNKYLLGSCFIAISFFAINGYLQFVFGYDLLGIPLREGYRITSFSAGPYCAQIVSMLIFPLMALSVFYLAIDQRKIKITHIIFYLVVSGFILISGERAAMLGLCIGLGITFLFAAKYHWKISLAFIVGVISSLSFAYFFMPTSIINRQFHSLIHAIQNFKTSDYGQLWIASIKIAADHPLFGVGTKNYEAYCKPISDYCTKVPHSPYMHMLSEYGVTGLILYLVVLCYIFAKLMLSFNSMQNKFNKFLLLGIIIAVAQRVLVITSISFFAHWYMIMLWFMVGWALYIITTIHSHKALRKS